MDYLHEKRNEHYHLNNFNIQQLTYLCKKLSCHQENSISDQVHQLLACVASGLSAGEINDILEEVTKIDDDVEVEEISIIRGNIKVV